MSCKTHQSSVSSRLRGGYFLLQLLAFLTNQYNNMAPKVGPTAGLDNFGGVPSEGRHQPGLSNLRRGATRADGSQLGLPHNTYRTRSNQVSREIWRFPPVIGTDSRNCHCFLFASHCLLWWASVRRFGLISFTMIGGILRFFETQWAVPRAHRSRPITNV